MTENRLRRGSQWTILQPEDTEKEKAGLSAGDNVRSFSLYSLLYYLV